jgi:DNA polymerase alpha subunit A
VFNVIFLAKKKNKDNPRSKPKAPPPPTVAPTISAYRPKVTEEQEKDFMSSLFGAMDQNATAPKPRKRKPSPQYRYNRSSSPIYDETMDGNSHNDASSDGPLDDFSGPPPTSSPDHSMSPRKKVRMGSMDPELEKMSRLDVHSADELDTSFDTSSFDDIDMEAFMDVDGADLGEPAKNEDKKHFYKENDIQTEVPDKKEPDISSWLSVYDSLPIQREDALGPLSDSSSVPIKTSSISALEPDGSFHFFWLDYLEHEAKLYFTGKLKDKVSGLWISCCVTVEGLQRNLFVLPRDRRVEQDEDGGLCETDIVPEPSDVYTDFDAVRSRFGIKKWKAKFVKRKYAFGESDVPKEERQWLKVVYGFDGMLFFSSYHSPG